MAIHLVSAAAACRGNVALYVRIHQPAGSVMTLNVT